MKTWKKLVLGFMIVAAIVLIAASTNLSSLVLSDDLTVGGTVSVTGLASVENLTANGLVQLDSSLYLGSTARWNGGIYMKVQNKAGGPVRVGEFVQWDQTYIAIGGTGNADSTSMAAGVAAANAEGGYLQLVWIESGGQTPANDSLFISGTTMAGSAVIDTVILSGNDDTTFSAYYLTSFTAMRTHAQTPATSTIKAIPLMGVIKAATLTAGDSTSVKRYCGVIYPSVVADDAVGWMLVQGMGKGLFVGLSGSALSGSGVAISPDSASCIAINTLANGNDVMNQIGYLMESKRAADCLTPTLLRVNVDFR